MTVMMMMMMQGKLSEIVRFMIFQFQTFQLVYASPDTSCVFIFPLIAERASGEKNLVLFLFKCTIYKNAHFFHVKINK